MSTIQDVARQASVSPTTVSRYLNNRIELPFDTAARIDAAVEQLDYRPNLLARRLSLGTTETLGLVTPEIANPFFAELAAAAEDEAERHGYSMLMSSTRGARDREIACLERLRDRHVDGLLMLTNRPDDGTLAAHLDRHGNVVLLDEDVPGVSVPRIFVENADGAFRATRHLIEAGHARIAHIGGPADLFSVRERHAGFRRAMREASLPVPESRVRFGAYTREHGHAAIADILAQAGPPPTAVFAGSDFIAIGILQGAREHGLDVPADLSLVGFDDMPFAQWLNPPLTTVRQPAAELARAGVQALLALLSKRHVPEVTRLPVELVERQSVRRVPG